MRGIFIQNELLKLLETIHVPLMVTDEKGSVLCKNRPWIALREEFDSFEAEFQKHAKKIATENKADLVKTNRFTVIANPWETAEYGMMVVFQVQQEETQGALEKRLEDTVKTNTSYQARLSNYGSQNYIATSDSMIQIFMRAKQVAAYPTTILLLGETGVGKEVVSSFIHNNSDRVGKPFIKINCSAIPEPLMESELFGYERGAFTGAREKGRMGLFELANHGTILLDEIGDMSLALQAKLLRTIQENEIMRVGGSKPIHLDIRIISATSRNIEEMMNEGKFLDALYYRLNVVELQIPPLRERREDIIPLAEFYLQHFCEKYDIQRELSQKVRECLIQYDWPGNVRELRNTVENLTVSSTARVIDCDNLPARIANAQVIYHADKQAIAGDESLKSAVESLQREMIEHAIHKGGSLRKAATLLDMDSTTLYRLAKKLEINLK